MYGHVVPNHEKLFVNQKCIASCWAATSEGIYNYLNPDKKTQDEIVLNNPGVYGNNYCIPKVLNYDFFIGAHDYMLDTVLSNHRYTAEIKFKPGKEDLFFIKNELHKNKPMVVFFDFHARIIFGYFNLGDQTYLQMFNPAMYFVSPFELFNPIEIVNYNDFIFRQILGTGTASVSLVYLKEKKYAK